MERTLIHSYSAVVAAIYVHTPRSTLMGYLSLANSANFCVALLCRVLLSLVNRWIFFIHAIITARFCWNAVALAKC